MPILSGGPIGCFLFVCLVLLIVYLLVRALGPKNDKKNRKY